MNAQRMTFFLGAADIDAFLEWLDELMREAGVSHTNRMRVRLLMEEILLRMRDRLGEDEMVMATFDHVFYRTTLKLETDGKAYNPLGDVDTDLGEWDSLLRTGVGLSPRYIHTGLRNVLRLNIPHRRMNSVARICFYILAGMALGIFGGLIVPDSVLSVIPDVLLAPTYEVWSRLLNALSGPVVFLTVITTMLSTHGIQQRGGNSFRVIVRYFGWSILMVAVGLIFTISLHPLSYTHTIVNRGLVRNLIGGVLAVVPSNVFDPFVESNTSQLLFLAFVLGYVLIRMGQHTANLKKIVVEANMVGLQLAGWMSRLVPVFVCGFLCLELWQGQTTVLMVIWQPLVLSVMLSLALMAIFVLWLSWRAGMPPMLLVRKIWKPFAISMRTGSLDESFDVALSSCTSLLGIDRGYAKEAFPQGLVLYMPISAVGTIAFTVFVARLFNVQVDTVWCISAAIMSVVVFVATPPVPGANLLAYVVLFSTLGIQPDALIDAMTFDVVFGIFAGAANQTMLQLEMVWQARSCGLLNKEVLTKPLQ